MKLVRFRSQSVLPRIGLVIGDEVIDILTGRDTGRGDLLDPDGIAILSWATTDPTARASVDRVVEEVLRERRSSMRYPLASLKLLPPVQPRSFRDFYAFETHVKNARARRGLEMIPEWYEAPAFYFSNTSGIVGHEAVVKRPAETRELDFELEIGAVIGKKGSDISVRDADSYIAGFTILNDWSARDIQRREMKVGLGPAKAKDFATSIGPNLVTPDELHDRIVPATDGSQRGRLYDLTMTAFVNGREYSRGNAKDMHWTFAELVACASRNTMLQPGDLIGSGTVGTGCITEFPEGIFPWLEPGDEVRLEVQGMGALVNKIG